MELAGECGPRRGQLLADRDQLAVDVGHQVLGPEHVLLGGVAGLVAELGDLDEVLGQPAALAQDRLGPLVEVEGVVGALDAGDDVELGGGELEERDLDLLLGRLAAELERAEPGELLGDHQLVGHVAHERVLGRVARERPDGVLDHRVLERRDLRDAVPHREHVGAGGLDAAVLGQGVADVDIDRLRAGEPGRGRCGVERDGHRLVGMDRPGGPLGGGVEVPGDLDVFRARGGRDAAGGRGVRISIAGEVAVGSSAASFQGTPRRAASAQAGDAGPMGPHSRSAERALRLLSILPEVRASGNFPFRLRHALPLHFEALFQVACRVPRDLGDLARLGLVRLLLQDGRPEG